MSHDIYGIPGLPAVYPPVCDTKCPNFRRSGSDSPLGARVDAMGSRVARISQEIAAGRLSGVGIENIVEEKEPGRFTIRLTDGTSYTLRAPDGAPGVGIESIDEDGGVRGRFVVSLTDGSRHEFTAPDGAPGVGIESIDEDGTVKGRFVVVLTDGSRHEFTAPGGAAGVGISSIDPKPGSDGVYVITLTDGSSADIEVPKGEPGNWIQSITADAGVEGGFVITLTDGSTHPFVAPKGERGPAGPQGPAGATGPAGPGGDDGVGIASILPKPDAPGTYVVTMTDGTTYDIVAPKGDPGSTPVLTGIVKGDVHREWNEDAGRYDTYQDYVMTFDGSPGQTFSVYVPVDGKDGADGKDGTPGIGIESVTGDGYDLEQPGNRYTMKFTDGSEFTFLAPKGDSVTVDSVVGSDQFNAALTGQLDSRIPGFQTALENAASDANSYAASAKAYYEYTKNLYDSVSDKIAETMRYPLRYNDKTFDNVFVYPSAQDTPRYRIEAGEEAVRRVGTQYQFSFSDVADSSEDHTIRDNYWWNLVPGFVDSGSDGQLRFHFCPTEAKTLPFGIIGDPYATLTDMYWYGGSSSSRGRYVVKIRVFIGSSPIYDLTYNRSTNILFPWGAGPYSTSIWQHQVKPTGVKAPGNNNIEYDDKLYGLYGFLRTSVQATSGLIGFHTKETLPREYVDIMNWMIDPTDYIPPPSIS